MKKTIQLFVLLFFVFISSGVAQQKYKRTLTVDEWISEMINCKEKEYVLENAEILSEYETKSANKTELKRDSSKLKITCFVSIKDCKLPTTSFDMDSIIFEKYVFLMNCTCTNMNFRNCEFREGMEILWGNLGLLFFENTIFGDVIESYEAEIPVLKFYKCSFNANNHKVRSIININEPGEGYKSILSIAAPNDTKRISNLNLDSCIINADSVIPVVKIMLADFNSIAFSNIDFKNTILNFETCSVEKAFEIADCKFTQPLGMYNFDFPEKGTNFHWSQIKDAGIAIYNSQLQKVYTATTDSQLSELNKYNELISSYNKLHSMYRTRGDMESANNCYIAMKDVETRRLAHLYHENANLNGYFNWKLNQFLKFFCQYGTSPIRALIISMWVILGFALFYFFFDSDWDKIDRNYLLNKYKSILIYFQSGKKLADYYAEKHQIELDSYNEFKAYLQSSSGSIPAYLVWLGKPLYRFSTTRRMLSTYIYSKVEILDGEWNSLKPKKKKIVSIITILAIFLFIVYALVSKAINSFFLSINTFSTLGFGSIPVKGISRYMAILQGFLGWFLLSIFSVSLINQILQN